MNIQSHHNVENGTIGFQVTFTEVELSHCLSNGDYARFMYLDMRGRHREALLTLLFAMKRAPGTSEQRACARNPTEKTENGGKVGATKDDQHYLG